MVFTGGRLQTNGEIDYLFNQKHFPDREHSSLSYGKYQYSEHPKSGHRNTGQPKTRQISVQFSMSGHLVLNILKPDQFSNAC
jgi:hypothetical protein